MRWGFVALILTSVATLAACQKEDDRQEVINKLRPLGVGSNPVIPTPGQAVTLTFHTATPIGSAVSYELVTGVDRYTPGLPINVIAFGADTTQDYASFAYHKVDGTFVIPPEAKLLIGPGQSLRLRYAVKVATSTETMTVVGDVIVFGTGSPEAGWAGITATITQPVGDLGPKSKATLAADLVMPTTHGEEYKSGWFVGGGEVKNRRARSTEWLTPDGPGTYTIAYSAHGKKTKAFAIALKDVIVQ